MKLTYSINQYDSDGDEFDKCILIHSKDDSFILRFENIAAVQEFRNQLAICLEQLEQEEKA